MPRSSAQHVQARRALLDDVREDRRGWLRHGVAALAVSALGLGVAGSLALTGNAQDTGASARAGAIGAAVTAERDQTQTSRSTTREAIDGAKLQSLADQRAEELSKTDDRIAAAASGKAVDQRQDALHSTSSKAAEQARQLAAAGGAHAAATTDSTLASIDSDGKSCLPVASYHVAARFGDVGSWARYHTGYDFAAPIGTTIRAPSAGVVTNAGPGSASGWAGNYVAIRYPDGTQSLMAHMSTVSVQVGEKVSACQAVGRIGMTGRTFGPHVHFEIYPSGIEPGDVYKAVDPVPWLKAHHLNP